MTELNDRPSGQEVVNIKYSLTLNCHHHSAILKFFRELISLTKPTVGEQGYFTKRDTLYQNNKHIVNKHLFYMYSILFRRLNRLGKQFIVQSTNPKNRIS